MNSIAWNQNKRMLQDTIVDYCNEESIHYDQSKRALFENTLNYYKDKIRSVSDIKQVNMQVLQHFVNTIQTEQNNRTQQTIPLMKHNETQSMRPQEIYSREEIIEARNREFQEKFNNVREEFANFKLKRPEEIDFSDKAKDDDNVSIDKRIEMELQQRQYDVENVVREPPKDVVAQFENWMSNPKQPVKNISSNSPSPSKKVTFNNDENQIIGESNIVETIQKQKSNQKEIDFKSEDERNTNHVSIFDKLKKANTDTNLITNTNTNTKNENEQELNNTVQILQNSIKMIDNKINDIDTIIKEYFSNDNIKKLNNLDEKNIESVNEAYFDKLTNIHTKTLKQLSEIENKYNKFSSLITKYGNVIKNTTDDTNCIIELYLYDDKHDCILYNKTPSIGTIVVNYIEVFNNDMKAIYSAFKNGICPPNILHMNFNRSMYNCYLKNTNSVSSCYKLNDNVVITGKKLDKNRFSFMDINASLFSYNKKHIYQPSILLYDSNKSACDEIYDAKCALDDEFEDICGNDNDGNNNKISDLEKRLQYYTNDDREYYNLQNEKQNVTHSNNIEFNFFTFEQLALEFNIDNSVFEILLNSSIIKPDSVNVSVQNFMESFREHAVFLKLNNCFNQENNICKFNYLLIVKNTTRELYNIVDYCYLTENTLYRTSDYCNDDVHDKYTYNTLLLRHNHTFNKSINQNNSVVTNNNGNNKISNDNNISDNNINDNINDSIEKIYLINPLLLYYSEI
jgi:hypothetical protein